MKIATDREALAASLAAGEIRSNKKKDRVTIVDRVFEALSDGYFNGNKLTVREIASKANVHERAIGMSILTLRRAGYRVNCRLREKTGDEYETQLFEYWFPEEGEEDINYIRPTGESADVTHEDIALLNSTAVDVLTVELEDMSRRLADAQTMLEQKTSALDALHDRFDDLQRRLSEDTRKNLLSTYKDDTLVEFALMLAGPLDIPEHEFRVRMYKVLREERSKK